MFLFSFISPLALLLLFLNYSHSWNLRKRMGKEYGKIN